MTGVATALGLSSYRDAATPEAAVMAAATTGSADDDDAKALRKFKDEIVSDIVKGYIEPLDQKVTEQSGNVSAIMVTLAEISTTQCTMMEQVAELPQSRTRRKSHLRSGPQLKSSRDNEYFIHIAA